MVIIAVGVFIGIVALVWALYWLLVLRDEGALRGRLSPFDSQTVKKRTVRLLKPEDRDGATENIEKVLVRSGQRWVLNLRELVEQSGLKLNVVSLLGMMAASATVAGFLIWTFTGQWILVALGVFLAGGLPYWYVSYVRQKRMLKFEEHFPEAIDLIARALRAGHGLPTGIQMVADEMPAPISTEFRTLYDEQNFGLTFPDALRNFARRIPVLDARFFVTAVLTQRDSGGNLAEVLDNLASVIRDRFKVKRQIRVISAHGRISGWVLAGLPPSLAAVLGIISPGHFQQLMTDPLGQQLIVIALVLQVIGTMIMRKIINVEY
jgi:tight adherence protein B